jgi:hypothetical protein
MLEKNKLSELKWLLWSLKWQLVFLALLIGGWVASALGHHHDAIILYIIAIGIGLDIKIDNVSHYVCVVEKEIIPKNEESWDAKYPEYKTWIYGHIATLSQEFSLPFPPYQGLSITDSMSYIPCALSTFIRA